MDPLEIPKFWIKDNDNQYLIVSIKDKNNGIRFFVKTNQKHRFKAHNGTHPNSVCIDLGGYAADDTLICSQINTLGRTDYANAMFKDFKSMIAKLSVKKRGCDNVLPGAYEKFQQGWRLTHGVNYAKNMDFCEP